MPAYIRPLFCRGIGPFRWVALIRRPGGYLQNRRQSERNCRRRRTPASLAGYGARRLISRVTGAYLLGRAGVAAKLGLAFNEMVRSGESPRRSSLAATTWTPALSPVRTVKPKPCATVRMRSPTGRC
ncbi:hypothetical protein ACVXG7_07665 [Enterobacter hormaechei]